MALFIMLLLSITGLGGWIAKGMVIILSFLPVIVEEQPGRKDTKLENILFPSQCI